MATDKTANNSKSKVKHRRKQSSGNTGLGQRGKITLGLSRKSLVGKE